MNDQPLFSSGLQPILVKTAGENLVDFHMPGHETYEETVGRLKDMAHKLEISFTEAAALHGFEVGSLADFVVK